MTEPALDRLRNQIADGFRDARVPSTVDEIADDSEVPEVHDLVGKHWSVVPLETIVRVRWDPGWFHRLGIRHYLPAFMLAAIREPEIAETVIAYLERGGVGGERDALWPDEKRAVRAWLRYMRDEHQNEDAAKALAIYWENPAITPLDEERTALFRRARAAFAAERTAHEATEPCRGRDWGARARGRRLPAACFRGHSLRCGAACSDRGCALDRAAGIHSGLPRLRAAALA